MSSFWFYFSLIIAALVVLKIYLGFGFYQATRSKRWSIAYEVISIASLGIGLHTLFTGFSDEIVGMTLWQNILIGLMVTFVCCELILLPFFLFDELIRIGSFIKQKIVVSPDLETTTANSPKRRRLLKTIGLGITSIPFISFLYGITRGKYAYQVIEKTITSKDLPNEFDGFKIVQFSDFHAGSFDSYSGVQRGIELLQAQNADLILFTGDLVNDLAAEVEPYKPLLSGLKAPYGKFSVLGNHDYPRDQSLFPNRAARERNFQAIQQHHKDTGFRLLNNENHKIEKGAASIRLLGVENWGKSFQKRGNLQEALKDVDDNEFSVLMTHDPTHWERVVKQHPKHIHLTLSGHTHGMQMGLELMGIKWSPVQYFYKHWAGLYKEKNQHLYVNRGFGFIGFAGRVGISPEITVLTLKKA